MNKNIATMKYRKYDTAVTFNRPVVMEAPVKLVNKEEKECNSHQNKGYLGHLQQATGPPSSPATLSN